MMRDPQRSTRTYNIFPYTAFFRTPGNEIQMAVVIDARQIAGRVVAVLCEHLAAIDFVEAGHQGAAAQLQFADLARRQYFTAVRIDDAPLIAVDGDRKSKRLNSSH